ncbi:Ubiquitin-conjugating enzyme E2 6 [Sphaceloma murrayae]|uniref:Ubiquitin-conjugating enzyme E2 6 n=1 Tax=Sphaceloma murrayae TaxID=2082308 RepID=A0A2K1QLR9_9PEZI|nr:Ubiquitin-conjugating enzyme E2 6 [Sphaceloma murrayae]
MEICVQCREPLMISVEDDHDEPGVATTSSADVNSHEVPDDIELACHCHFHWQCFLDNNRDQNCPNCGWQVSIPTAAGIQLLVNISNEGGFKESENIYPLIVEENYIRAHPEERICRAFLELCREGDLTAVNELLGDCERRENARRSREAIAAGDVLPDAPDPNDSYDSDEEEDDGIPHPTAAQIMRYQDPLGNMDTGLHAAIANRNDDVAWLLLFIGTNMNDHEFPAAILEETRSEGIQRQTQEGLVDIRSIRNAQGKVPLEIAQEMGDYWHTWLTSGRLVPAAHP